MRGELVAFALFGGFPREKEQGVIRIYKKKVTFLMNLLFFFLSLQHNINNRKHDN